jgi:hypothetical protein
MNKILTKRKKLWKHHAQIFLPNKKLMIILIYQQLIYN